MEMYNFRIRHGGRFVDAPSKSYVGGHVSIYSNFGPKDMSYIEMVSIMKSLHYSSTCLIFHKLPDLEMGDGLRALTSDRDVMDMVAMHQGRPYIPIYAVNAEVKAAGPNVQVVHTSKAYKFNASKRDEGDFGYHIDTYLLDDGPFGEDEFLPIVRLGVQRTSNEDQNDQIIQCVAVGMEKPGEKRSVKLVHKSGKWQHEAPRCSSCLPGMGRVTEDDKGRSGIELGNTSAATASPHTPTSKWMQGSSANASSQVTPDVTPSAPNIHDSSSVWAMF